MASRMNATEKAQVLLEKEQVFRLGETDRFIYYSVKGSSGIYDITIDKLKEVATCECKNIRLIDCSHLHAAKEDAGIEW